MSDSEEKYRNKKPPYIDDDRLLINTRLSEIERQQNEDKKYQREYDRKQLKFNKLLTIFTGLLFVTSVVSDVLIWRYVSLTKQSAEAATSAADTASKVQQQGTDSFNKTLAQMESQTEAQQVSAQAGRTSVETMRNSMQWSREPG